MKLAALLDKLGPTGIDGIAFPRQLLGTFRRKSITFCTGVTDETTVVYWFQSKSFTIDLRLPDAAATPVVDRQGWIGDTVWDEASRQLSWNIHSSYQPAIQWPEAASFAFIGNSVIEFAPSGAYVEDWRQQSSNGPYLGLRLVDMYNDASGEVIPMHGGVVLAGEHTAYTQSRLPSADHALRDVRSLDRALASGIVTEEEIASYEVSVAMGGSTITHSTQYDRVGCPILSDNFEIEADGSIVMPRILGATLYLLRFSLDHYVPEYLFSPQTPSTSEALDWMQRERGHLMRHAIVHR